VQIRTRLTLQFAGIFAIILLVFCLVVYYFTSLYRKSDFFFRILNRAHTTAQMYLEADEATPPEREQNLRRYYQALPHEIVQVYGPQNQLVFHDGAGRLLIHRDFLRRVRERRQVEYEESNRQVVGILHADNQGEFVIVASSVDEYSLRKLANLKVLLILGYFASLGVVLLAGWVFAKQALRPIQKIVAEVKKINASDLHRRLSQADGRDEVSHLASTFNNLLDRLERAFEMQNTFISNASHELRTPLTAMIGEMEVALMKHRDAEEYERVLVSILEDARRLTALSNGLLQIASASFDASKIKMSPLRIDEVVWMAAAEVQKRRPGTRIEVGFDTLPEEEERLTFQGNESLLLIALLNVFDNAAKFSPATEPVHAILHIRPREVVLRVVDRGRGIGQADLKHVFVPFFRAENVRDISGHGIGLPLAEKIFNLHNGSIFLRSTIGEGTEVTITLPS
jgi:signal transduction histidine kinase